MKLMKYHYHALMIKDLFQMVEFTGCLIFIKIAKKLEKDCDDKNNWEIDNTKMHPLHISHLVIKIINDNKNVFKFILDGL